MDRLLENHKLPKLLEDEIDNLNNVISIKEIKFTGNFFKRNAQTTGKFQQTFKEKVTPIMQDLFQKIEVKILSILFYQALIQDPNAVQTRKL